MAKAPTTKTLESSKNDDRLIGNYPSHLRGIATNRYGGNNLQHERGLRGGTYGPAGPARIYSEVERKEYERELRLRGELV
jgi:hypothetical protein